MDQAEWGLVACIMIKGAPMRMDSVMLPVDGAQSRFEWVGRPTEPVVSIDGFPVVGPHLTLAFRLKCNAPYNRIAFDRIELVATMLEYREAEKTTSAVKRSIKPRRCSMHATEHSSKLAIGSMKPSSITLVSERTGNSVTIDYIARRHHDAKHDVWIGRLSIYRLVLEGKQTIRHTITRKGDKVTCMLKTRNVCSEECSSLYLGRPQRIRVDTERMYVWEKSSEESGANDTFRGTTNRGDGAHQRQQLMEEANELRMIRDKSAAENRILTRRNTFTAMDHVADNDATHNPCYRLPFRMERSDQLVVRLYNFLVGPPFGPHNVEIRIEWADFVACIKMVGRCQTLSGNLKREFGANNIECRVRFTLNTVEKSISIERVECIGSAFDFSTK